MGLKGMKIQPFQGALKTYKKEEINGFLLKNTCLSCNIHPYSHSNI